MAFDIKKTLRSTAAVLAFTLAGAGAGGVFNQALSNRNSQTKTPEQVTAQMHYRTTLTTLGSAQAALQDGNDEEAAMRLDRKKRTFVADALLDKNLSETDLASIARDFNGLSAEDGIVFRNSAKQMKHRDEALEDVAVTRDRVESALRLEDAMVAAEKSEQRSQNRAAAGGALAGAATGLAFFAGLRRRKQEPKPGA
jgi:hypothetical protein